MIQSYGKKEEILSLNVLRFFAAFLVLFAHTLTSLVYTNYIPKDLHFLVRFSEYGHFGVDLFFIISGFVIALSSEGRTLGQFISARFIRLFPVFWLCVSITSLFIIFLSNEHITVYRYLANLTMLPYYYGDYIYIDVPYWTLEIELKFYLIIGVVLLLKAFVTWTQQRIAVFLSFSLLYYSLFYDPSSTLIINKILGYFFHIYGQDYLHYFIAGMLFYGIYKNSKESPQQADETLNTKNSLRSHNTGQALRYIHPFFLLRNIIHKNYYTYIAIFICYFVSLCSALGIHKKIYDETIVVIFFITIFFGIFLVISLRKITNTSFSFLGKHYRKILIIVGAITYPLYLLHSKITYLLLDTFAKLELPPYIAIPLPILLIISFVFLVNGLDFYIQTIWKKTFIIQKMLERYNLPWLKKVL